MSTHDDAQKLEALGYALDPAGLRRFQAEFNQLGPARLLEISGQLDARTREALALAYASRTMLARIREGRG
ncbi:hypothetical protein ACNOYE_07390 [Nannocystaceae bacterium ST9]